MALLYCQLVIAWPHSHATFRHLLWFYKYLNWRVVWEFFVPFPFLIPTVTLLFFICLCSVSWQLLPYSLRPFAPNYSITVHEFLCAASDTHPFPDASSLTRIASISCVEWLNKSTPNPEAEEHRFSAVSWTSLTLRPILI